MLELARISCIALVSTVIGSRLQRDAKEKPPDIGRPWRPVRIAMEAGTHSIWISEQIREMGHEVTVANVRELRAISHSDRKSDTVDAEKLARYAQLDPEILCPIAHRTVAQQETLTLIHARDVLVRLRTSAVNSVRGLAKPCGYRLPASSTLCFAKRCLAMMPFGLAVALSPLLHQIADMTVKIKEYDLSDRYPDQDAGDEKAGISSEFIRDAEGHGLRNLEAVDWLGK
jgi:transposase